jgi:hypothetical protein
MNRSLGFGLAVWALGVALSVAACAPNVGSERWCAKMHDKPRGDWTANEALDYAKSCVVR